MVSVRDVDPNALIETAAEELKKIESVKPPIWAAFVKTGSHKERIPYQKDWWYNRTAALLRRIYLRPLGVNRLRKVYGGRKKRGMAPERFQQGSGAIIRKSLMQLEAAGFVKKTKKGREITPKGQKFMDGIAAKVPAEKTSEKTAEKIVEKVDATTLKQSG